MINVRIIRDYGDDHFTYGRLLIEGAPLFRCYTEEKPLMQFTAEKPVRCAIPDGVHYGRILMDGTRLTIGFGLAGHFARAQFTTDPLNAAPLGCVRIKSTGNKDIAKVLSDYLTLQAWNGMLSSTRPKRGEIVVRFETASDFKFEDMEREEKPQFDASQFDLTADDGDDLDTYI